MGAAIPCTRTGFLTGGTVELASCDAASAVDANKAQCRICRSGRAAVWQPRAAAYSLAYLGVA